MPPSHTEAGRPGKDGHHLKHIPGSAKRWDIHTQNQSVLYPASYQTPFLMRQLCFHIASAGLLIIDVRGVSVHLTPQA